MLIAYGIRANAAGTIAHLVNSKHELGAAFLSYTLFGHAQISQDESVRRVLETGTTAQLNHGKLSTLLALRPNEFTLEIPFGNSSLSIDLIAADVLSEDFAVFTGEGIHVEYRPGFYCRGIVTGNSNSVAAFSFFENEIFGIVSDSLLGNLVIARLEYANNTDQYIIYRDKDLLMQMEGYCHSSDDQLNLSRISSLTGLPPTSTTTNCVRLYYELDHQIFLNKGSVVNAANWITAVHNNVSVIYANDNINVALSSVYVWNSADPYTGTNSNDQLTLFRSTRPSFNGDVGQLVAHDGSFGGLGYLDALCRNIHYSYADVDYTYNAVPTYSWTVEVITHEFGHNLGSPHTHNCNWPVGALDDCYPTEGGCAAGPTPTNGGTIMSYCHLNATGINFSNGFGTYPSALIRSTVDNAPCLGTSCAVCQVQANNSCSLPVTLNISANCVYISGNLCGATESVAPATCSGSAASHGYDLWYRIVPTQTDLNLKCLSGTNTDIVLALYSGTCAGLTLLQCVNATGIGGLETITTTVTPGTPYLIRVYDQNGNTTDRDFAICASHNCSGSPNNSCSNATTLPVNATCSYVSGELCAATQSISPAMCSGYTANDALDVWYTITPSQSNVHITALPGAGTDLILGIYSGTCGSLNLIDCVDQTGQAAAEELDVNLTIGNTYYVRIYDWNGNEYGTDYQVCAAYGACTTPNTPINANATSATICEGSGTNLNVVGSLSAGAKWHWYSGSCGGTPVDTGSTIQATPSITTTYYVRAEVGTCFSSCRSVTVSVTHIPASPTSANSNPPSVCSGAVSQLTVTGTLTSGASWHWYEGSCSGTGAGAGASITVQPTALTTYYVRAENGNCYSSCTSITVNTIPVPAAPIGINSSASTLCSGDSSTLSVNGSLSPGASWKWYSDSCGGSSISSSSSIGIVPTQSTTYYVRSESSGCVSSCENATVNVSAIPSNPTSVSASATDICYGDTAILSVIGTLAAGNSWQWYADSCGGNSAGGGNSINTSPSMDATYYVRAENGNCHSACLNVSLGVNSIPVSPSIIISGDSVFVSPFASYQWYFGTDTANFIMEGSDYFQRIHATGYYFVIVTDSNGCSVSSDTVFTTDPTFIPSTPATGVIDVSPNPATDRLVVDLEKFNAHASSQIHDMAGRVVYSTQLSQQKNILNIHSLAPGMYMLVIRSEVSLYLLKFVKN